MTASNYYALYDHAKLLDNIIEKKKENIIPLTNTKHEDRYLLHGISATLLINGATI